MKIINLTEEQIKILRGVKEDDERADKGYMLSCGYKLKTNRKLFEYLQEIFPDHLVTNLHWSEKEKYIVVSEKTDDEAI